MTVKIWEKHYLELNRIPVDKRRKLSFPFIFKVWCYIGLYRTDAGYNGKNISSLWRARDFSKESFLYFYKTTNHLCTNYCLYGWPVFFCYASRDSWQNMKINLQYYWSWVFRNSRAVVDCQLSLLYSCFNNETQIV